MQTLPYDQYVPQKIRDLLAEIQNGIFGDSRRFSWLHEVIGNGRDSCLICEDFESYLAAQYKIDQAFQNRDEWTKKSICSALRVAGFSSDRTAEEYSHSVWLTHQET